MRLEPGQVAVHDLPASAFPFVVLFLDATGHVVHKVTVDGPGVLEVPALRRKYGPISTLVEFADGRIATAGPGQG